MATASPMLRSPSVPTSGIMLGGIFFDEEDLRLLKDVKFQTPKVIRQMLITLQSLKWNKFKNLTRSSLFKMYEEWCKDTSYYSIKAVQERMLPEDWQETRKMVEQIERELDLSRNKLVKQFFFASQKKPEIRDTVLVCLHPLIQITLEQLANGINILYGDTISNEGLLFSSVEIKTLAIIYATQNQELLDTWSNPFPPLEHRLMQAAERLKMALQSTASARTDRFDSASWQPLNVHPSGRYVSSHDPSEIRASSSCFMQ